MNFPQKYAKQRIKIIKIIGKQQDYQKNFLFLFVFNV